MNLRHHNVGKANAEIEQLRKAAGLPETDERFWNVKKANAEIERLEKLLATKQSAAPAAPTISGAALARIGCSPLPVASAAAPVPSSPRLSRLTLTQLATKVFSLEIARPLTLSDDELRNAVEGAARKAGVSIPGVEPAARELGVQGRAHRAIRQDIADAVLRGK